MEAQFDYGQQVRVIKNIRNDGTFPGQERGALLIRRGSVGYVKGVGKFLQDQVIYQVHFIEQGCTIGCRDTEVQEPSAPWSERQFERGDKVSSCQALSCNGEIVVNVGDVGTILGLVDKIKPHSYRVSFAGRAWQIPESALQMDEENSSVL